MGPRLYYASDNPKLAVDRAFYHRLAGTSRRTQVEKIVVPIRTGRAWPVRMGQVCRIVEIEDRRSATSTHGTSTIRASDSGRRGPGSSRAT
jgi:hypothetical protein